MSWIRIAAPLVAVFLCAQAQAAPAQRGARHRAGDHPRAAAHAFDGRWSVEVITENGDCDRAYRWSVGVSNDRIADIGDAVAQASGSIGPKGQLSARFTRGADVLTATGSLGDHWGVGKWSAPSRSCSGRWVAEKRG